MAKQTINLGTAVNDGTGDPLRIAFDKINDNFDELYLTDSDIAGDDTQVLFNDSEAFGADADFTYNKTTNALTVAGNVTGGNLVTGAQVVATGNVTGGNLITAGLVSATGNVTGGNIAGTRGVFTNVAGTLETATQTNITSVGTLTALTATGNVTGGNLITGAQVVATGNVTGGNLITNAQVVATGNVTGGNLNTGDQVIATGNVTGGNLITGAQVIATGNVTGGNLNTSGNVAGLYIKGDGSELTGITASATPAGADTHVQFNDGGSTGGDAGLTFNKTTDALTVAGNVTGGNLVTGAQVVATGNVTGGNLITAGLVSATGNVTGGNLITAGSLSLGGTIVTSTAAELNKLDGFTGGVTELNYLDALHATGVTSTEFDYLDGVSSNIQSQLNAKAPLASPTFTTAITTPVITKSGTNGAGDIGQTSNRFATIYGLATSAQYADLAEKYTTDHEYEAGTVVIFGGNSEITQSTISHDRKVAGVISTNPAVKMNDGIDGQYLALQGRVPTRVLGPIEKGDLVVTSNIAGVGEKLDDSQYYPGCVIGKALESITDNAQQVIEVVVGRL